MAGKLTRSARGPRCAAVSRSSRKLTPTHRTRRRGSSFAPIAGLKRILDARPDTVDFRDSLFEVTLIEVPPRIDLEEYRRHQVPILDQGQQGACTGFGLATVANFLLRTRTVDSDSTPVSPRMLYNMARRYDEWPGEGYSGSSARGAMKGWHKHGVCAQEEWPYVVGKEGEQFTHERIMNARLRRLGAYYRVNHKDLVCMHSALAEVGILYATAQVHAGWQNVGSDGKIMPSPQILGGHAFAIVAYDRQGLWIQNSWGAGWGRSGFCHVSYDDWLANGTDVWVARLGVPLVLTTPDATATTNAVVSGRVEGYTFSDLRPHVITIGNDGELCPTGTYANDRATVARIIGQDFDRITAGWTTRRLLLYAHGGLTDEQSAIQRVADYRQSLLKNEVYPLSFIWKSDFWTTVSNILRDAIAKRKPEGLLDATKNFMLDRIDDALEPIARTIGGKAAWDEMKENAEMATTSGKGGARAAADEIAKPDPAGKKIELHIAGHSAGSIFMGPLLRYLIEKHGQTIESITMWAPACTIKLFKRDYFDAIKSTSVGRFALFMLTDRAEQDDNCANIYHKSLLYLVSNAFEDQPRIPLFRDGVPLLGMERFVRADPDLAQLFKNKKSEWIMAPNTKPIGSPDASGSISHGGFDDDPSTVAATLARILGKSSTRTETILHKSDAQLRGRRRGIDLQTSDRGSGVVGRFVMGGNG